MKKLTLSITILVILLGISCGKNDTNNSIQSKSANAWGIMPYILDEKLDVCVKDLAGNKSAAEAKAKNIAVDGLGQWLKVIEEMGNKPAKINIIYTNDLRKCKFRITFANSYKKCETQGGPRYGFVDMAMSSTNTCGNHFYISGRALGITDEDLRMGGLNAICGKSGCSAFLNEHNKTTIRNAFCQYHMEGKNNNAVGCELHLINSIIFP